VVLVTTAATSPAVERRDRERRYLITMALRVVAILVAIIFATGWIRIVAIGASLILPWVAVVVANAPGRRESSVPTMYDGPRRQELTDHVSARPRD
jgi:hypothetical protein